MKVNVENAGPCRKKISVEFSAEEVDNEYGSSLKYYLRHGTVKGFRPGKAPEAMIRRAYDKQILSVLKDHLLATGFQQAMKEHKLQTVAEYDLQQSTLASGQPFSFSLVVDVAPEFELPEYKGIEVDAKKIEIADEAVTQALNDYLKSLGQYEDVTEPLPVEIEDIVAVDYTSTLDGEVPAEMSKELKDLLEATDRWVVANQEYSFLPEFGTQLIGAKVGDTRDITVQFEQDAQPAEVRGKKGVFKTTVKKIRRRKMPVLDEATLQRIGAKSEEDVRDMFRQLLRQQAEIQEQRRRREQVEAHLLKTVENLDLPESEESEVHNNLVYSIVDENLQRGVKEQEIRENLDKISASAKEAARTQLKLRYLLKRIADAENLVVTDQEVDSALLRQAQRDGVSVKDFIRTRKLNEAKLRRDIRTGLRNGKAMDAVLSHAKLTGPGAEQAAQKQEDTHE